MFRLSTEKLTVAVLALALAAPPLWWAGEALASARAAVVTASIHQIPTP